MRELVVAADGRGDFVSVQAALDALPTPNTTPVIITLRAGTYAEVVRWRRGKDHITLRGEDRQQSIIAATNNENLNSRSANRALFVLEGNDCVLENLTLHNTTPKGGSQAEALKVDAEGVQVLNADLISYQDTVMLNGLVYVRDCLIAGDVDFIWGFGTAFLTHCEIRARYTGYNAQARNPAHKLGYVFVECQLTCEENVREHFLGRTGKEADHLVYIDCTMAEHIASIGWHGTCAGLGWYEYGSKDRFGNLLEVTQRQEGKQLSAAEAQQLRDPHYVLQGWQPERKK